MYNDNNNTIFIISFPKDQMMVISKCEEHDNFEETRWINLETISNESY